MVEGGVGLISNPQNITKMTRKPWCAKALPQWVWWCTVIVNHLDVSLCMSHHTGTRKAKVTKEPSVKAAAWPGCVETSTKTAASMRSGISCAMSLCRDHKLQNSVRKTRKMTCLFWNCDSKTAVIAQWSYPALLSSPPNLLSQRNQTIGGSSTV